jgi:putative phage-type endonuclease
MDKQLVDFFKDHCKVFSTVSQQENEEEWLKARTRGIGGSDVGPICGVSHFTSARQIYLSKTGQADKLTPTSDAAQQRMNFGHLLEPIVADEYSRQTGDKVISLDATLQHNEYPWALANVDRIIVDDNGVPTGILECKTSSEFMNDYWERGEIPETYIYQVQWYMFILGLPYCEIAALVGGNKFYHYRIFKDDEFINDKILPKVKSFWYDNVLQLKEPELQENDTELVNNTYVEVVKNSEVVLDDDESNNLASMILDAKAKIKDLESIVEAAQNRLKDRMKENEIGYTKDFIVKWSQRSSTRTDEQKLKEKYPEVYADTRKLISFRAMSIKGGDQ